MSNPNEPVPNEIEIKHESRYLGDNWWGWAVWVEAPQEILEGIEYVEYQLHPDSEEPLRRVTDHESNFRLESAGGGEFKITLHIKQKDGLLVTRYHELTLEYPPDSAGEVSDDTFFSAEQEQDQSATFLPGDSSAPELTTPIQAPLEPQLADGSKEALTTPPEVEHTTPTNAVASPTITQGEDLAQQARAFLSGRAAEPRELSSLAKKLKNQNQFGLARKLLSRARKMQGADWTLGERLQLAQQHALTTYKDPDLPSDQKFARALAILQEGDDLPNTKNQETLGLAGAIYKRLWEVDADRGHLARSLSYYLRGYQQGVTEDYGYTGINAAFVLDVLASLEEEEAKDGQPAQNSQLAPVGALARRQQATEIRQTIIKQLPLLAQQNKSLLSLWWFLVTIAEAHFGLRQYQQAQEWLMKAVTLPDVSQWECQSTALQLARLAQMHAKDGNYTLDAGLAIEVLKDFLSKKGIKNAATAVTSAFSGKIGLALSGGGFRAALFHIGVLAKLADIGVLSRIEAISCVSGGSIIGAHYYLELRKLFRERAADANFERYDYIDIIKNLERDFLAGVQTNIRTRVLAGWWSNVKMIFSRNYSRTLRVGELYEKHIYSQVMDNEGEEPRYLDALKIIPRDEPETFAPKNDNWRRINKIPILILNATSLNSGHNWQFTASFMGEPPAAINTEIDANFRLRRMYYPDAPRAYRDRKDAARRIRLGYAVASSSCVPGAFEPIALAGLYKDKTVRLVDGGVFDNQGTAGLLEQECSVLLVSDASGQLVSENDPASGPFSVLMRASSISQERIRWAQYRELEARRRAGLLKGLMFIHLKKDLDTDPVDWIDCPDPYDSTADARPPELRGPLTRYGVRKDIQELLAGVRTDLDSFTDGEACALMASGYFMAEYEFANRLKHLPGVSLEDTKRRSSWRFLDFEAAIKQPGRAERLKELLTVASQLPFKIWQLARPLCFLREWAGTLTLAGLGALLLWYLNDPGRFTGLWSKPLVSVTLGNRYHLGPLKLGWAASLMAGLLVAKLIGTRAFKIVNWRQTLWRWSVGLLMGTLGFLIARFHLWTFDKWYLRWGRRSRVIDLD